MAIYKCKMCSGELDVNEGVTIVECDFCGTKQTVPTAKDENLQGLFNRANVLRQKSEFDKASSIYEKIIEKDETQAEAYWGLILCKFGIEYVEDPATLKRVPTCHRTSYDSIISDDDYKSAINYADSVQRGIYEAEAKEIDRLQKEIIALSQKEEPYDVFICYKETDSDGKRTQDSVIANDIYYQLTQEGLKVFYAAITLENKLGSAYEPCIFAALNSAKVMLVIGTKPEYFNAVWVKNEWSRFLKIIEKDRSKLLIPCFRDMDAYELPEEFAHLQAQDMSKIGFINDVVRGIKKVVASETKESPVVVQTQVVEGASGNVKALLDRGFMALEDGEWKKADDFFEQVLNFDAKLAEAYLGKLMVELQVRKRESLKNCAEIFDNKSNYQKVIRFADEKLKAEIEECVYEIKYIQAKCLMNKDDIESYQKAINLFESIIDYKDSKKLKEKSDADIERIRADDERIRAKFSRMLEKMQIRNFQVNISAGSNHTVGLKSDGTVVAVGGNGCGQCEVSGWRDILAISAGSNHTVGLKSDGTVVATKYTLDKQYYDGQCNVSDWQDIVAISAGSKYTVGLKSDGTVVAVGDNEYGQRDVSDWRDIVAISADSWHTVGLKSDGTVVAVGSNKYGQRGVSDWQNIVAISAGLGHTVGLKSDGTVVATKYTGKPYKGDLEYKGQCDVSSWRDIVAISAGSWHTVGLKSDGTVIAVGLNGAGQCEVSSWRDIVAISADSWHTVGLKSDGTVVAVGNNSSGQCNVSSWRDISVPILSETKAEYEEKNKKRIEYIRKAAEEKSKKQEAYRNAGVCQHCGGSFKGLFTKTCSNCGKKKDY